MFKDRLCKTEFMILVRGLSILLLVLVLGGCFSQKETKSGPVDIQDAKKSVDQIVSRPPASTQPPTNEKDKSLATLTRYFAQADGIHKEAWWVLTSEKRPAGKSPFGKVERALMASANIKLANKSMFRCDRYVVKRETKSPSGYPQKVEISEKCSDKLPAKKIAEVQAPREGEVQVTFFPENLEEILGLGPTILNKLIECSMKANEAGVLTSLQCKNWSQDRTREQMVRLDTYDYQKDGKNLIKLRGKIYENLSDTRRIEADVPLEGKISVTETELYPPEGVKPSLTPAKKDSTSGKVAPGATPTENPSLEMKPAHEGAPDTPAVDPDLIQGRFHAAPVQQPTEQPPANVPQAPGISNPADQGWPVDEQGNPLPAGPPLVSPEEMQPIHETTPEELAPQPGVQAPPVEGVPHGR